MVAGKVEVEIPGSGILVVSSFQYCSLPLACRGVFDSASAFASAAATEEGAEI